MGSERNSAKIFATVLYWVVIGILASFRKRHKIEGPYMMAANKNNLCATYRMLVAIFNYLESLSDPNLAFKVSVFFNVK